MATDTQKSTSQKSEVENSRKTLTLTVPNPPDLTDESKNPSTITEPEPKSAADISTEDLDNKEADDSKGTGTQGATSVVSPMDNSGSANDIQKKIRRAERFGVPVQLSEEEKRNSRAERFGTATGSEAFKASEDQKRKARAERFGLSVPADEEEKKKARLARFGSDTKVDAHEEEKRKARVLRFSQPPSNAMTHMDSENTVIAGNATGGA